jgi:hypothetical protein
MMIRSLVFLKLQERRTLGCQESSPRATSIKKYIKIYAKYNKIQAEGGFKSFSRGPEPLSGARQQHRDCWVALIRDHNQEFPAIYGEWDKF